MATAPSLTFASLRAAIHKRQLAPVYLLHGEEGYFIDQLIKDFDTILTPDEKEFNQYVLYAPRIDLLEVGDICRRFPMMSDRLIVIVKEAQAVRADQLDRMARYVADPAPQTTLVICSRGEKAKGRKLLEALKKSGAVIFESKKIPDYQIGTHISALVKEQGLTVDPKSLEMLKEYVGNDLSKLYNEITKLTGILGKGAQITPESIEYNIGFSKEFNAYELVDALAARDGTRALRIADYFRSNPKASPLVLTSAAIFSFFADLLITYFERDKSEASLMRALGLKNSFQLKRFNIARSRYNAFQVIEIIRALRQFDTMSKGCGSRQNEHQLFRELIFHILTAPGHLGV